MSDFELHIEVDDQILNVSAIYRDDVHGCTSFETPEGPKLYLRAWDNLDHHEWGWVLNGDARKLWPVPSRS